MTTTYEYNKPRRLNFVSVIMLLVVLGGGYAAVKFVPVWWQARKVDEALDEYTIQAATFYRMNDQIRQQEADKILTRALGRLHDMGIKDEPDQPIQVWFSPDWSTFHAKYMVIVKHPVGKPTVMIMERKRDVPRP